MFGMIPFARHEDNMFDLFDSFERSFFGGGITVAAALCAEALLFANTNLPLHLVRPAACAAASLGALVTGFLAAGAMPKM